MLDQYFIVNEGVIDRAIRYADVNKNDTVLEIGPGLAFITTEMAKKAGKVIAIELDKRLERVLKEEMKEYPNFELVMGDALKVVFPKFNKIVSAIPYSASAPITFKLLDYDFDAAVLFFQREFGEKMLAQPCEHEYGRLSVMAQYYFDVELKEVVPRSLFYPQPKVDSVIVLLKKKNVKRDPGFDVFIREIFRYKNKNVSNAVKMGIGKEIADERKVDSLEVAELRELYERLK
ncbi:ribosomal RNA small subunit methyltransferase A [Candidatus Micrarchaeota archaeon]|nr:ribosomal RNA small subunit methyltransferase A [Candidatus Micrarchaeota archaeon]